MLNVQGVRLASLAPSRLVWLATRPSAGAGRLASPCYVAQSPGMLNVQGVRLASLAPSRLVWLATRPSAGAGRLASGLDMDTFLIHVLNSLLYASVLFLIAGGLSLIYGVMRIVNLAHGNLYAFG